MTDMTESAKRKLGIALVIISLVAVAVWVVQAYQAKRMVGSPFAWAAFLIAFFWGTMLAAGKADAGEQTAKRTRRWLIVVYLAIAAALSLIFLGFHWLTAERPLPPAQSYSPFILVATILSYPLYQFGWARRAGLQGMAGVLSPVLYLCGIVLAVLIALDYYNMKNDQVEIIPSPANLDLAKSNFINFAKIEISPDEALRYDYHVDDRKGNFHKVTYKVNIPVLTGRQDTLYDLWIAIEFKTSFNKNLPDDSIVGLERIFFANCRSKISMFKTDSVLFYDRSKLDDREVLRKREYPLVLESRVMLPVYRPLDDYVGTRTVEFLVGFIIITLFFWGSTTFMARDGDD